jgi:ribonuclease P protein component
MRQLDWEKEIPKMMSGRRNGNNILEYRTPLFSIKAVKSSGLVSHSSSYSKYNPLVPNQKDKTPFGIVTTIKSISKSAVERNRVRTRFKEAIRLALTRDLTAPLSESGKGNSQAGPSGHVELPAGKSA